ncbi:MAG: ankyrin repeat domain-containing protein [Candidatus Eremiobacteraeota bacterium]|nr:ankyrin repeat domain-containing protein [Candidatus Eremiobacteraeota bacterium]
MGFRQLLYILFAAVLGAQWGGMVSVSSTNVMVGAGMFLVSLVVMVVGSLGAAAVLRALKASPRSARDNGIALGVIVGGGIIAFGLTAMGATQKAIGYGAAIVAGISIIMIGYEAYQDLYKQRVTEKLKKTLAEGLKATYSYDYEKAGEIYENAILTAELGLGSVDTQTVIAVRHLADMYKQRGQFNRCGKLYLRCIATFEQMADPPASDYASVLHGLSQMYQEQKDIRSAAYYAQRALEILKFDQGSDPLLHVRVLKTLASFYAMQNDFGTALIMGEQACAVLEKAGMDAQRATLAANLIDFMIRLGRQDEALARIQELMQERQRLGMVEDGVVGQMLMAQAVIEEMNGRPSQQLKLQALAVVRRSGGPDFPVLPKLIDDCMSVLYDSSRMPPSYVEFMTGLKTGMTNKCVRAIEDEKLIGAVDGSGWAPMQWATFYGKEMLVEALLEKGANVNVGVGDATPLHIASRWGHTKVMTDLLGRGADVNAVDSFGSTPLHGAACSPANRAVDLLVAQNAVVDPVNEAGYTPLQLAAMAGRTRMIIDLMECRADINFKNPKTGESALHLAVKMGHRGATEGLVMCGATKNAKDNSGKTPMSLAKAAGRDDLINLLK